MPAVIASPHTSRFGMPRIRTDPDADAGTISATAASTTTAGGRTSCLYPGCTWLNQCVRGPWGGTIESEGSDRDRDRAARRSLQPQGRTFPHHSLVCSDEHSLPRGSGQDIGVKPRPSGVHLHSVRNRVAAKWQLWDRVERP